MAVDISRMHPRRLMQRAAALTGTAGASIRILGRCISEYRLGAATSVVRAARAAQAGFDPETAFRLGLLDPAGSPDDLVRYVSKRTLMRAQRELNPAAWSMSVQNKHLFHRLCSRAGLPVPRLHGLLVTADRGGEAFALPEPGGTPEPVAWEALVRERLPEEFVVKPVFGYRGEGIRVLRKTDGLLDLAGGGRLDLESLRRSLDGDPFGSFLFQERLRNHPDLARLSGSDFLQTVRVATLVRGDGTVALLDALLKPIVGRNVTDNYRGGRSGNLLVQLRPGDGTLECGAITPPSGPGVRRIRHHPDTGVELAGYRLPMWRDVRALLGTAARAFLPLRTIGWDVALTPSGPVLVEGNVWWDPPNPLGRMGGVLAALRAAGEERTGDVPAAVGSRGRPPRPPAGAAR